MYKTNLKDICPFLKIKNINFNLVSIIFIFNTKNEVLLQLRDDKPEILNPNIWGPLGGHCNLYETPYNCALRELQEESGYICKKLYWYKNFFLPYKNNTKQRFCQHLIRNGPKTYKLKTFKIFCFLICALFFPGLF